MFGANQEKHAGVSQLAVRIVHNRHWFAINRTLSHIAHYTDDFAEWILVGHPRTDSFTERLLSLQKLASKCLVHDEMINRSPVIVRFGEVAPALQRNTERPEVSGHYGQDEGL